MEFEKVPKFSHSKVFHPQWWNCKIIKMGFLNCLNHMTQLFNNLFLTQLTSFYDLYLIMAWCHQLGGGLESFLRWWPPSAQWMGPLIFYGDHRGCLNSPIFSNLGLCGACWAHFMCHYELWPTSASHPFSFLTSSLGLAGGKHYLYYLTL